MWDRIGLLSPCGDHSPHSDGSINRDRYFGAALCVRDVLPLLGGMYDRLTYRDTRGEEGRWTGTLSEKSEEGDEFKPVANHSIMRRSLACR